MRSLCVLLLQAALVCVACAQQPPPVGDRDASGYDIRDDILITTREGATLSATVVRKKGVTNFKVVPVQSDESLDLQWFPWDALPGNSAPELPRLVESARMRLGL